MIPNTLQRRLWDVYVPGQEVRKDPTDEYMEVSKELISYVRKLELDSEGIAAPESSRKVKGQRVKGSETPEALEQRTSNPGKGIEAPEALEMAALDKGSEAPEEALELTSQEGGATPGDRERESSSEARDVGRDSFLLALPQGARSAEDTLLSRAFREFELSTGMELAPEQREAVSLAERSAILVITGGPGVGKTTIVRAILSLFRLAEKSVRLAATTGRAAKRMAEIMEHDPAPTTLHRLLEYTPAQGGCFFKRNQKNPIEADVVIVDETSMLDVHLADALFQAIRPGTRLILVGDVDQLPSVDTGAVLRDILKSETVPKVVLTKIFRQAEASLIVTNAHRVRRGLPPLTAKAREKERKERERLEPAGLPLRGGLEEGERDPRSSRNLANEGDRDPPKLASSPCCSHCGDGIEQGCNVCCPSDEGSATPSSSRNHASEGSATPEAREGGVLLAPPQGAPAAEAPLVSDFYMLMASDEVEAKGLVLELATKKLLSRGYDFRDIQVLTPMHRGECGTESLNQAIQKVMHPFGKEIKQGARVFRRGDRVMQVKNDHEAGVYNGDVGEVTRVEPGDGLDVTFHGGTKMSYLPSELDMIQHAYAQSIHKSQGNEYRVVVIAMLSAQYVMLSRNLLYTAMTRGKELVFLITDPKAMATVLSDKKREVRRTRLTSRILRASREMGRLG